MPRSFPENALAALGAVVRVEEDGTREAVLFLAPQGGGHRLADGAVQVVTPKSPLGRAILGKRAGDDCEVVVGGQRRELSILEVR